MFFIRKHTFSFQAGSFLDFCLFQFVIPQNLTPKLLLFRFYDNKSSLNDVWTMMCLGVNKLGELK